jgi:16S rRNA (guanine966-N2)-methyltransferase
MQIIAGKHRGRKLETPQGRDIRPTGARAREAVFNILMHAPHPEGSLIVGARVADICCGSGAMGLEALSRGVEHACFIDRTREALGLVKTSAEKFRELERCTLLRAEATQLPAAPAPCRVVFLDPPYKQNLLPAILASVLAKGWLEDEGVIVAELSVREAFECPSAFLAVTERTYANTRILLLKKAA